MPHHGTFIDNLFTATDVLNGLQGLAIFIIFTCKPNTCKQLEGQFKKLSLYFQEKRGENGKILEILSWKIVVVCRLA